MANILIIDDDRAICDMMSHLIKRMGYNVSYCLKLKDGLKKATEEPFDLILLDVFLPDGNGLCALPEFLDTPSVPEIIIMTGQGTPDSAEEAINAGSWTYIQKPFSAEEIRKEIPRVLKYREEKVARKPLVGLKRQGIIGSSAHIRRCLNDVSRAGITGVNVLLIGETGTGK